MQKENGAPFWRYEEILKWVIEMTSENILRNASPSMEFMEKVMENIGVYSYESLKNLAQNKSEQ